MQAKIPIFLFIQIVFNIKWGVIMLRVFKSLIFLMISLIAICVSADHDVTTIGNVTSKPLLFTENQGQWNNEVLYRASAGGVTIWFTKNGAVYQFNRTIPKDNSSIDDQFDPVKHIRDHEPDSIESISIKTSFVGANLDPVMRAVNEMEYKCNYFIGNDPNKWHTDVSSYQTVVYEEIYSGIDLKYYSNGKQIEYDFIVSPGADPSRIEVKYEGARSVSVNTDGELVVGTIWGEVVEQHPVIYQLEDNRRVFLEGEYSLLGENTFGFNFGDYNPSLPVVIDPVLTFSSYLGGSDKDCGRGITVDESGAVYVTGYTESINYPGLNPYQGTYQGSRDVFITKLSSSGNSLVYSTYLGGNGQDNGEDIAVDASGAVYVTGTTRSTNFPTLNPYQTDQGLEDAFIIKLSSTGNNLIYSTYIGGSNSDRGLSIELGTSGNTYITGYTESSNFPTLNPYQGIYQGGDNDVFITKLNSSGESLVYSTYLGGTYGDEAYDIAVDAYGAAYVTGRTFSTDFPIINPYQGIFQGGENDVFVTKLSNSGDSLIYSTYLGGSFSDEAFSITVDSTSEAYVTGRTYSTDDFPILNQLQGTFQGGDYDGFVTKLSSSGNNLVYSTYIGGNGDDYGYSIDVDTIGAAYVMGTTYSTNFPTLYPYQTYQDSAEVFVTKLSNIGDSLVYSTYLGGIGEDYGIGFSIDVYGVAYVTGRTSSTNFPTKDPYQGTFQGGGYDAFITKLSFEPPVLEPILVVTVDSLNWGAGSGWMTFYIENSGNASLNWTISENCSWITDVLPVSGTVEAGSDFDKIEVQALTFGLTPGIHSDSLLVTSNGGNHVIYTSIQVNQPPEFVQVCSDISLTEGDDYTCNIIVNDPDNDNIEITMNNHPLLNSSFSDNGDGTADFSFHPDYRHVGDVYDISISATDGKDEIISNFHMEIENRVLDIDTSSVIGSDVLVDSVYVIKFNEIIDSTTITNNIDTASIKGSVVAIEHQIIKEVSTIRFKG